MTLQVTPQPGKPWEVTVKQRAATGSLIALAIALAFGAVYLTGLNGKLGFAVCFFVIATGLIFVQQLRLRDLQSAKDALLSSFAMLGIVLTLIPIVSIVSVGIGYLYQYVFNTLVALTGVCPVK